MKIQEFFEKGYYINLDRRTDRRESFEKEMARVGLDGFFERMPGVEPPEGVGGMEKHKYYGEAHHAVLRKAKAEGYDRILIFEDDACFYDDGDLPGIEIVERSLDQLEKITDWDVMYFGGHPVQKDVPLVAENLCKVNGLLTTHAIGYSATGLDKVLNYLPLYDAAIDGWISLRPFIQKYMSYPLACVQTQGVSDLDAFGSSPGPLHFVNTFYSANYVKEY